MANEERRPLYITQKELDAIAKTPIFEHILAWESMTTEDGIYKHVDGAQLPICSWSRFLDMKNKADKYDELYSRWSHRTDITMCSTLDVCLTTDDKIVDRWIPLDPQPSCKSCKNQNGCGIRASIDSGCVGEYSTCDFYCNQWGAFPVNLCDSCGFEDFGQCGNKFVDVKTEVEYTIHGPKIVKCNGYLRELK